MDQRSLILLGLLMSESQHGYQLNEFIEKNLNFITIMKKPTAYATLDKLCSNGFVEVKLNQGGNRPPRKVYTINDRGKQLFYDLLLKNLSSAENVYYDGDIGLMFIDYLPIDQSIAALEMRVNQCNLLLAELIHTPKHEGIGVNIAIQHKQVMLKREISFLQETVQKLQSQIEKD
ncbi:PadR family transcriptional regulator [Heyndrickxia sporothermodurans]